MNVTSNSSVLNGSSDGGTENDSIEKKKHSSMNTMYVNTVIGKPC
jgi:hypothetical protein